MKKIFTLLFSSLLGLFVFAADPPARVTVSLYGNNDYRVYIDGRSINSYNNRVFLHDIRPGRHRIEVFDQRGNRRRARIIYSNDFIVRPQFDLNIIVDRYGYVRFDEDRNYRNGRNDRNWNDRDRDNDYNRNREWDKNRNYDRNDDYDRNRDWNNNKN